MRATIITIMTAFSVAATIAITPIHSLAHEDAKKDANGCHYMGRTSHCHKTMALPLNNAEQTLLKGCEGAIRYSATGQGSYSDLQLAYLCMILKEMRHAAETKGAIQ